LKNVEIDLLYQAIKVLNRQSLVQIQ